MRLIKSDVSNYFLVQDPGSWHCCVTTDPFLLDDLKLVADDCAITGLTSKLAALSVRIRRNKSTA